MSELGWTISAMQAVSSESAESIDRVDGGRQDSSELNARVAEIRAETTQIKSFTLVAPDGRDLPQYSPGAHIDVKVPGGPIRQYSLVGNPDDLGSYIIAVKLEKDSRGGSLGLHTSVKEGDILTISSPRNHFPLSPDATHHTLIGAGIGITPLISMSRYLTARHASHDLLYFCRSHVHLPFRDDLLGGSVRANTDLGIGLSREDIAAQIERTLSNRRPGSHLYVCGPTSFMDHVVTTATPTWEHDAIHRENFVPIVTDGADDTEFEVELARSGLTLRVPPAKSIVEVLEENGIEVPVSCEQGVCGTCITRVLHGRPDHRDSFLLDHEKEKNDCMAVCVSRSLSGKLVLDL